MKENDYFNSQKAMDIFRAKFGPSTVFLFASDDPVWVNEHFGNLSDIIPINKFRQNISDEVSFDFAALASCNHSIIRYRVSGNECNF